MYIVVYKVPLEFRGDLQGFTDVTLPRKLHNNLINLKNLTNLINFYKPNFLTVAAR